MELKSQFDMRNYLRNSHVLICLYCLSAGLSFFVSQFVMGIFIVYTLTAIFLQHKLIPDTSPSAHIANDSGSSMQLFTKPLLAWSACVLLSSTVGVDPIHSLTGFPSKMLWLLIPYCIAYYFSQGSTDSKHTFERVSQYVTCFAVSLAVAGTQTLLSALLGFHIDLGIPGPVTASGQLALVIPVIIAMLLCSKNDKVTDRNVLRFSGAIFFGVLALAWSSSFFVSPKHLAILWGVRFVLALAIAWAVYKLNILFKKFDITLNMLLLCIFLFSCLVINLKRGPWFAVVTELMILGAVISRRIVINTLIGIAIVLACLIPARERLLDFADDFLIKGGRENMWQLGFEIVQRFPLGVGLDNAKFMRTLDPSLPPTHRHMHNNFLNQTVEFGWIGLTCYIWWMVSAISISLRTWRKFRSSSNPDEYRRSVISLGLAISIIGWQVAGLVEYNFGDGEVKFIAFTIFGLILALSRESYCNATAEVNNPPVPIDN